MFGREGDVELLGTDGTLTPYAGTGSITTQAAVVGDGGPAVQAQFGRISDVVVDSQGVMYLADEGQGVVRRVKPDGTIDTVLGLGATRLLEAPDGTLAADSEARARPPRRHRRNTHDNLYVSVRSAQDGDPHRPRDPRDDAHRTRHDVPEPDSAHVRHERRPLVADRGRQAGRVDRGSRPERRQGYATPTNPATKSLAGCATTSSGVPDLLDAPLRA